jgi:hypothetical protein
MKKTILILCAFLLVLACKKETTTTFRSDAPSCVVNIAKSFPHETTVKKMTDGTSFYWRVQTDGSPQIADDEFLFIFNDNCDTLCRVCFCPKRGDCSVDLSKLVEVK